VLRGHDNIRQQFRQILARDRLGGSLLFVGPTGIGKRQFALHLAQSVLCERRPEARLDPCGECPSCRQVLTGTHPDVDYVARPADKAFIPVEVLIGDKEHRMRAGLCYNISLRPYSGRRKVAIIDDADYLNKEGANCLLKTLEEPPLRSVLILLGTSEQRQLPTIRSRCQVVRFAPLETAHVEAILLELGLVSGPDEAHREAELGQGSVERAAAWCDPALVEFRRSLVETLCQRDFDHAEAARLVSQFVDQGGKEAAAKRNRLRLVVSLAEEFYRELLRASYPSEESSSMMGAAAGNLADPQFAQAIQAALRWIPGDEALAACLDLCVDCQSHIDANANQATLIDWWLDELASAARSGRVAI
jgi:DNA polymerase-3 subunit delta'